MTDEEEAADHAVKLWEIFQNELFRYEPYYETNLSELSGIPYGDLRSVTFEQMAQLPALRWHTYLIVPSLFVHGDYAGHVQTICDYRWFISEFEEGQGVWWWDVSGGHGTTAIAISPTRLGKKVDSDTVESIVDTLKDANELGYVNEECYEVEQELDDAAWQDLYASEFIRELSKLYPDLSWYLDEIDVGQKEIAWALYEPLGRVMESEGTYWESEGTSRIIPDFEALVAEVDPNDVVVATAPFIYTPDLEARRQAISDFLGVDLKNPEQIIVALQALTDDGVAAQAFGRPMGFLDMYDDEEEAASARAEALGSAALTESDIQNFASRIEGAGGEFSRLLHRWLAALIAVESIVYMLHVPEEGGAQTPDPALDLPVEERATKEASRWMETLHLDYPTELPESWLNQQYWAELEEGGLSPNGLCGYDVFGWPAETPV